MVHPVVVVAEAGEFTLDVESVGEPLLVAARVTLAYLMAESESRAIERPATP